MSSINVQESIIIRDHYPMLVHTYRKMCSGNQCDGRAPSGELAGWRLFYLQAGDRQTIYLHGMLQTVSFPPWWWIVTQKWILSAALNFPIACYLDYLRGSCKSDSALKKSFELNTAGCCQQNISWRGREDNAIVWWRCVAASDICACLT